MMINNSKYWIVQLNELVMSIKNLEKTFIELLLLNKIDGFNDRFSLPIKWKIPRDKYFNVKIVNSIDSEPIYTINNEEYFGKL